jgi:hypothetical protein
MLLAAGGGTSGGVAGCGSASNTSLALLSANNVPSRADKKATIHTGSPDYGASGARASSLQRPSMSVF